MRAQQNSTGTNVVYQDSSASAAGQRFLDSTSTTGLPTSVGVRTIYPVVTLVEGADVDTSEHLLSGILTRYSRAWQILAKH